MVSGSPPIPARAIGEYTLNSVGVISIPPLPVFLKKVPLALNPALIIAFLSLFSSELLLNTASTSSKSIVLSKTIDLAIDDTEKSAVISGFGTRL